MDEAAALVERAKRGDHSAFEGILRLYRDKMLSVARGFLPTAEDAEDAVQDASLLAWRALPRFDERAKVSTWLHRIVVNSALQKKRRRRPTLLEDNGVYDADPIRAGSSPDPAEEIVRREVDAQVREKVEALPASFRAALALRLNGMALRGAASVLDVTIPVAKIRLHRGIALLRNRWDSLRRKRHVSTSTVTAVEPRGVVRAAPMSASISLRSGTAKRMSKEQRAWMIEADRNGMRRTHIARALGVSMNTICYHLTRCKRSVISPRSIYHLDDEEREWAADAYIRGMSSRRIAKHVGVTPTTVLSAIVRAGVAIRPRGARTRPCDYLLPLPARSKQRIALSGRPAA